MKKLAALIALAITCIMLSIASPSALASVTVTNLNAKPQADSILISWNTGSEISNIGFDVLRGIAPGGPYSQINPSLILSACTTCIPGSGYSFTDSNVIPGQTYYYQLDAIDSNSAIQQFGPVSARIPTWTPTTFLYFPVFFAVSSPSAPCAVYWDPRLGPDSDPILYPGLQQIQLIPASVAHGQYFWRAIIVRFEGQGESGNDHTIYVTTLDESCHRAEGVNVRLSSAGGLYELMDLKLPGDTCNCSASYPMFGDSYNVNISNFPTPSETVAGMCMCGIPNVYSHKAHVNFRLTFQRLLNP